MFKNAHIVSINTDPNAYRTQKVEDRGSPDYVMSSSDLRLLAGKSPSWWKKGGQLPASDALEYGSLLDTIVLTPDQFDKRFIIQPAEYESKVLKCPKCGSITDAKECRKCKVDRVESVIVKPWSNNSGTCAEWCDLQAKAGRQVVTQPDLNDATQAMKRIYADPQCSKLLITSDKQVWVEAEWHDEATKLVVRVRCLIDFACCGDSVIIGDLKSTKSAAVGAWAKWARFAGYDMQGAWNFDMFIAATKRPMKSFCFILSESSFPFEIGRRYLEIDQLQPEQDDFTPGRSKYRAAMRLYCQCIKSGKWPGYDDTDEASLSGWTRLAPDPYDEQRRMFAPKFITSPDEEPEPEEPNPDLTP